MSSTLSHDCNPSTLAPTFTLVRVETPCGSEVRAVQYDFVADAFIVVRESKTLSPKHSAVVFVERATGLGWVAEYTTSDAYPNGKVFHRAVQVVHDADSSPVAYEPFDDEFSSWRACCFSHSDFLDFVERFEWLSNYEPVAHDGHVFHRSLAYSIAHGRPYYNERESAPWSAWNYPLHTSQLFVELPAQPPLRAELLHAGTSVKASLCPALDEHCPPVHLKVEHYDASQHSAIRMQATHYPIQAADETMTRERTPSVVSVPSPKPGTPVLATQHLPPSSPHHHISPS